MKQTIKRMLCLALVAALLSGLAAPVIAAGAQRDDPISGMQLTQVPNSAVSVPQEGMEVEQENVPAYADTDVVRVSIILEGDSTVGAGFSPMGIAENTHAMAYRADLQARQKLLTASIERATGSKLDVAWNLTLAANLISANVAYRDIEKIGKVPGVAQVLIENRYDPDVLDREEAADPMMVTSSDQIGSAAAWACGYTGAGSRIAVIDTGTDTDHQSFRAEGFRASLLYGAGKHGVSYEQYVDSLELLDAAELEQVKDLLNVQIDPAQAYHNEKLPFGYNYVDGSYDITHDNDTQGSHGSHVAGIAAANAWIVTEDGGYSRALDSVLVQGVAPDAQLITMKVFGASGGAYESDYMAAIEDALVLGCDAINLSLGSGSAGDSRHTAEVYQQLLDGLTQAGAVVAVSAGNNSYWGEHAFNLGYVYAEDANLSTAGSPGTYTNSLTVASVDNDGLTSRYIRVGEDVIFYTEALYNSQKPLTYIAGENSYVFIDGMGTEEDWAATGVSLAGKVAICARGGISFAEKATIAIGQGAKALIVYNNQDGVFGMDLTDYIYTWPCVSITQADGDLIRSQSTANTDDSGNVLYYSGTLTVSTDAAYEQYDSEYYTMSSFSSWGVPGSLELKPEITAPGGSIYSVNGVDPTGTAYEVMSGTSMASPQIAGMAAVIAQYIRESGLEVQTGLTARQLTQSLLMSTAKPLVEEASGSYYAVMQQGAGLANVSDVIGADSYILMGEGMNAGAADGKVKAELGDDPDREGVYEITFTLNNLTGQEKAFRLSGDFFTQNYFEDHNMNMGNLVNEDMYNYMDTRTMPMAALTTWTVDGRVLEAGTDLTGMDFNDDGTVDALDGQALLDYAVGVRTEIADTAKADLDADGDVDTYDAYLFFKSISTAYAIVPADSAVEITVTVELTEAWDQVIGQWGTNGLYIEGYLFAEGLSDEEGTTGTCHSIPVLGWYGNWSDPPMYDVEQIPFAVTKEDWKCPYVGIGTDFIITYGSSPTAYYFTGNPLGRDTVYKPGRNAINGENGTMIKKFDTNLIRNAAAMRFTAFNESTGELLLERTYGSKIATYYVPSSGGWNIDLYDPEIYFKPQGVSEGDVLVLDMAMAPEYYLDENGEVDWDALGKGSHFTVCVTIDNTAPVLEEAKLDTERNIMTVQAYDNQYVAGVTLIDSMGNTVLAKTGSKDEIEAGSSAQFELDMEGVTDTEFFLQITDYARNTVTYFLSYGEEGESEPLPQMMAFSSTDKNWQGFSSTSTASELVPLVTPGVVFQAAAIADHMVVAATDSGDLYVLDEANLAMGVKVANLGVLVTDMAYNPADGRIYAVTDSGELVTVNKMTAEVSSVGQIGVSTNTLACAADGTFYCNKLGSGEIYRFTLETLAAPELFVTTNCGASAGIQAMEVDLNDGKLYWLSAYIGKSGFSFTAKTMAFTYLYEIDTEAATYVRRNNLNGSGMFNVTFEQFSCLVIPVSDGGVCTWPEGTDVVESVRFASEEITIYKTTSGKDKLNVSALPWNLTDTKLVFSSSDESIVRVDENGVVTGLKEGSATVTAAAANNPAIFDTITVNVVALDITIEGVVPSGDGSAFFSWNMKEQDTWAEGASIGLQVKSATASTREDVWYVSDSQTNNWTVHKLDAQGNILETNQSEGLKLPLWDMAYAPYLSECGEKELVAGIYEDYFLMPQDPMSMSFTKSAAQTETNLRLVALASCGYHELTMTSGNPFAAPTILKTERYVLLDNSGNILEYYLLAEDRGLKGSAKTDLELVFPGFNNLNDMYCSLVLGDDGALYLSAFTGEASELYRMTYDDAEDIYHAEYIGTMGEGVYPASVTAVRSNAAGEIEPAGLPVEKLVPFEAEQITVSEILDASAIEPNASAVPGTGEETVSVTVTAPADATNGLDTVTYDADKLILEDVTVLGDYSAVVRKPGSVTFGYVDLNGVSAGETVAVLTFRAVETEDTTVTVEHKQVNNASGGTEEVSVIFPHENTELRYAQAPTCTTAGYSGDVYCLDCGKLLEKGSIREATGHSFGEWSVCAEPNCFHDGLEIRTCTACGLTEERDLPASSDGCPSAVFGDLNPQAWYHEGIDFVVRSGWMNGRSDAVFAPDENMNRAELITVLYRIAGSPDVQGLENPFADVAEGTWFTDAVVWAYHEKIVNGISADLFAPAQQVSREMTAVILYRYSKAETPAQDHLSAYADADSVSGYARDAMNWAVGSGILKGMPGNILAPRSCATRAQLAAILLRMFG